MNIALIRELAEQAGFEFHERFKDDFCGSLWMLQQFVELVKAELNDRPIGDHPI